MERRKKEMGKRRFFLVVGWNREKRRGKLVAEIP